MQPLPPETRSTPPISSISVLAARLTWLLLGPIALLMASGVIITQGTGWTTATDAVFAAIVGLMLLGRWVEHRSGAATTAAGDPATPAHLRHYLLLLPAAAVVIWLIANLVGNHLLNRG